jgi:hypothetical protein
MKYVELQDKNFGILHGTIGPTYKSIVNRSQPVVKKQSCTRA